MKILCKKNSFYIIKKEMDIQIIPDAQKGYTAIIKELSITTEWDTRDELLVNIREALQCYYESKKKRKTILEKTNLKFYFDMKSIAYAA